MPRMAVSEARSESWRVMSGSRRSASPASAQGVRTEQYIEKFRRVFEGQNLRMFTGTWMLISPRLSSEAAWAASVMKASSSAVTVPPRAFAARRRACASSSKCRMRAGRTRASRPRSCTAGRSVKPPPFPDPAPPSG